MTVGSILKQAREEARFTRGQLGEKTGISARTIEKYEYDTAEPPLSNLKKICDALGLNYADVIAEVDEAATPIAPSRRGDVGSDIRQQLTAMVNKLGGTTSWPARVSMRTDDNAPPHDAAEDDPQRTPAAAALLDLRDLERRCGQTMPAGFEAQRQQKVAEARRQIAHLDYAGRFALADEVELPRGAKDELMSVAEVQKLRPREKQIDQCRRAELMLVFAQICPKFWDDLSFEQHKKIRDSISEHYEGDDRDSPAPEEGGWWESKKDHASRLRKELPAAVVQAVQDGKPVAVPQASNSIAEPRDEN